MFQFGVAIGTFRLVMIQVQRYRSSLASTFGALAMAGFGPIFSAQLANVKACPANFSQPADFGREPTVISARSAFLEPPAPNTAPHVEKFILCWLYGFIGTELFESNEKCLLHCSSRLLSTGAIHLPPDLFPSVQISMSRVNLS